MKRINEGVEALWCVKLQSKIRYQNKSLECLLKIKQSFKLQTCHSDTYRYNCSKMLKTDCIDVHLDQNLTCINMAQSLNCQCCESVMMSLSSSWKSNLYNTGKHKCTCTNSWLIFFAFCFLKKYFLALQLLIKAVIYKNIKLQDSYSQNVESVRFF